MRSSTYPYIIAGQIINEYGFDPEQPGPEGLEFQSWVEPTVVEIKQFKAELKPLMIDFGVSDPE